MALLASNEVPEEQRAEYQKGVAKLRLSISGYISELEGYV